MSTQSSAARAVARTPTGRGVVVADLPAGRLLRRLAGRRLDAVRIHHEPGDTP